MSFFKHFLLQKQAVLINFDAWKEHDQGYSKVYGENRYGFSKFASYFFTMNKVGTDPNNLVLKYSVPKFNVFIKTMPNLKKIIIMNVPGYGKLGQSLLLSDTLFSRVVIAMNLINSLSYSLFESIEIVEPASKIQSFINNYGDKFQKYGWIASRSEFEYTQSTFLGFTRRRKGASTTNAKKFE